MFLGREEAAVLGRGCCGRSRETCGWSVGRGLLCPGPNPGGRGEEALEAGRLLPLFQAEIWQEPEVKHSQACPRYLPLSVTSDPPQGRACCPRGHRLSLRDLPHQGPGCPGVCARQGCKGPARSAGPFLPQREQLGWLGLCWDFAGLAFPLPGPASPLLSQAGSLINIVHTELCFLLQKPQQHPEREHRSGWPGP